MYLDINLSFCIKIKMVDIFEKEYLILILKKSNSFEDFIKIHFS